MTNGLESLNAWGTGAKIQRNDLPEAVHRMSWIHITLRDTDTAILNPLKHMSLSRWLEAETTGSGQTCFAKSTIHRGWCVTHFLPDCQRSSKWSFGIQSFNKNAPISKFTSLWPMYRLWRTIDLCFSNFFIWEVDRSGLIICPLAIKTSVGK